MTPSNLRYPTPPGPRDWREPLALPDRREPMAHRPERIGPPQWWEFRAIDPREALIALLTIVVIVFACSVWLPA